MSWCVYVDIYAHVPTDSWLKIECVAENRRLCEERCLRKDVKTHTHIQTDNMKNKKKLYPYTLKDFL